MSDKKGFTLIEIVIFIVVFSVGVMGLMFLFYNVLGKTSDPTVRSKVIQIAQSVMETIVAKKFDDDTPIGGGSIPDALINIGAEETNVDRYDDVDDYAGSGGCGVENDLALSDFGLSGSYQLKVSISFAKIDSATGKITETCGETTDYKIIKVKVISEVLNESYVLYYVKGNF